MAYSLLSARSLAGEVSLLLTWMSTDFDDDSLLICKCKCSPHAIKDHLRCLLGRHISLMSMSCTSSEATRKIARMKPSLLIPPKRSPRKTWNATTATSMGMSKLTAGQRGAERKVRGQSAMTTQMQAWLHPQRSQNWGHGQPSRMWKTSPTMTSKITLPL